MVMIRPESCKLAMQVSKSHNLRLKEVTAAWTHVFEGCTDLWPTVQALRRRSVFSL